MAFLQWINANWDLILVLFGIAVNAVGLIYNICKLCRNGKAKRAFQWIRILEAARQYEIEAESFSSYTSQEKLQYVLSRLRIFTAELGCEFDEVALTERIEADIAFSKEVNADKSERLD
ncbi:MAG: hypothetical protein IJY22_02050 [Clostridia bacterium]|nr:hypothetical protein [Clostridia bacterium]